MRGIEVTVGPVGADIVGSDNRALQAAVDYVATLGGGIVRVLPGTYLMHDSLHLRSRVRVVGAGTATVLRKADATTSPLYLDGDYGEEEATLASAKGFDVGMGLTVLDDNSHGFHTTVATILSKDGNSVTLSRPLLSDYMVDHGARAQTTFPVVSGYYIEEAAVEGLTIEGSRAGNPLLNGCRGGGVFLYRANRCQVLDCHVYRYNGDGISFQQSNDVAVEACECAENAGLGLHPGSGSQRPTIRNCWSHHNDQVGLYLCWRVRQGRFEDNRLEANGSVGISIGHKDTDNLFSTNLCLANGLYGLLFREESEPMAGHRNTFVGCQFLDNGTPEQGAGVRIDGETHGLTFRDCLIGNSPGSDRQRCGISIGRQASGVVLERVRFQGNGLVDVEDER